MQEQKDLHGGHRDRLRKTFLEEGMEHFFDHQAVELMLFYCVPRKDTNNMAHDLLERFGSFSGLLAASSESLQKCGISSHTAVFIRFVSELCSRYYNDKYRPETLLDDMCIEDIITSRFTGIRENKLSLVLLDAQSKPIFCDTVSTAQTAENIRSILHSSIMNHASIAVVVRNRPGNTAVPSRDDLDTVVRLRKLLADMKILLLDYYIVSDKKYCSLLNTEEYEHIFFD